MTAAALLIAAAFLGQARAVVHLSCSDNATCIENLTNEFVRSVRQQKTVRLFDTLTVEPLGTWQKRSSEGLLEKILNNNAFSFDWNDYTFRIWKDQDKNDALDLEVYESRTAKDVSEELPKKSKSKVEEEDDDTDNKKTPKIPKPDTKRRGVIKRRAKKKIMQAVIPMLFGMKSAAAVIFAMAVVTVLTLKAFIASKMALMVTVGMAIKRLYESYSLGIPSGIAYTSSPHTDGLSSFLRKLRGTFGIVGLQNHPYLYSQYPIDFPSASSHAYSVSGMSPQFPEMYNPTALGTHQQTELLHNDASAQQSQQAPVQQLLNSTRATERWDGKSKLQKLLEPIVDGIKSYIDPIASVFYSMPATFRGLSSDVTTTKTVEPEEEVKKPREILVPQPRNIAQRKMNYRKAAFRTRPKKYTELKVDLDKLKKNKDLYDYIKTKKYKYNYQHTYYYPRVKYFVNPNMFIVKPKNKRLVPYRKDIYNATATNKINVTSIPLGVWKPIVLVPVSTQNVSNLINVTRSVPKKFEQFEVKKLSRAKRSLDVESKNSSTDDTDSKNEIWLSAVERSLNDFLFNMTGRGFVHFMQTLFDNDPITAMVKQAGKYTKSALKHSLKSTSAPYYYTATYEMLMMTLDVIDGLVQVHHALIEYFIDDLPKKKKTHTHVHNHSHSHTNKKKRRKPSHHQNQLQNYSQNQTLFESNNRV